MRVLGQGMTDAARRADVDQSDREWIAARQRRAIKAPRSQYGVDEVTGADTVGGMLVHDGATGSVSARTLTSCFLREGFGYQDAQCMDAPHWVPMGSCFGVTVRSGERRGKHAQGICYTLRDH